MITLNMLPCSNCTHFKGTKYKSKTEKTEFISCEVSKTGNAEDILTLSNRPVSCRYQEEEE